MSRELTPRADADADADVNAEAGCMQFNCSPIDFALGQSVASLAGKTAASVGCSVRWFFFL